MCLAHRTAHLRPYSLVVYHSQSRCFSCSIPSIRSPRSRAWPWSMNSSRPLQYAEYMQLMWESQWTAQQLLDPFLQRSCFALIWSWSAWTSFSSSNAAMLKEFLSIIVTNITPWVPWHHLKISSQQIVRCYRWRALWVMMSNALKVERRQRRRLQNISPLFHYDDPYLASEV